MERKITRLQRAPFRTGRTTMTNNFRFNKHVCNGLLLAGLIAGAATGFFAQAQGPAIDVPAGNATCKLSRDESAVACNSTSGAYVWTKSGGLQRLDSKKSLEIEDLSADGTIVAGKVIEKDGYYYGFVRTQEKGVRRMMVPGFSDEPKFVSADGLVIVGVWEDRHRKPHVYRWIHGKIDHICEGEDAAPAAISANGEIVVGRNPGGFRWTKATGLQQLGADFSPAWVSDDGDVVVGVRGSHLVKWTQAAGLQDIVDLGKGQIETVRGAGVVYGTVADASHSYKFWWTAENGVQLLNVEGTLSHISPSADGKLVMADYTDAQGQWHHVVENPTAMVAQAQESKHKEEVAQQAQSQAEAQAAAHAKAEADKSEAQLQAKIAKIMSSGHPAQIYSAAIDLEVAKRPDLAAKLYQVLIDKYPDDTYAAKAIDRKEKAINDAAAAQQQSAQQAQDQAANARNVASCRAQCQTTYDACSQQAQAQNNSNTANFLMGMMTKNSSMTSSALAGAASSSSDCESAQNSCNAACK